MTSLVAEWPPAPADLTLNTNDVHVCCTFLDRPREQRNALWLTLAPEEKVRAGRFYFERDKHRFIVARGVLRALLGRYLEVPPEEVAFTYGEHGKPEVAPASAGLQFNLSHTQGVALYAVGRGRLLGVDVEQIRPLDDATKIAGRFFSSWENVAFRAVPDPQKPTAFFNCWTRKEAYIKAIGEGLSCPLDAFDVSLAPGEPARLLRIRGSEAAAGRWSLYALSPAADYVGALVVEGGDSRLSCWQWW
jgi:4'-phosphopantetheinyl transferase